MQIERPHEVENTYHQVNQQADLEKSQSNAQREMTSIHIKMKNSLIENQAAQLNQQQFNKFNINDKQQINNQNNGLSNQKIGSQNRIIEGNKLQIYQQVNSGRGERNVNKNDNSVLNVIQIDEYHKVHKQDNELLNNISHDDNGEEPLISPENKFISSKFCVDNTLFSLFYTLVTIGGIILYIYSETYWLIIVGATLYYLECICTNFIDIFEKLITENDFYNMYKNALNDEPQIQFKAKAYTIVIKNKHKQKAPQPQPQSKAQPQQQTQPQTQLQIQANQQQLSVNEQISSQDKIKKGIKEEFIRVRELIFSEQRSFDYNQHKDFSHSLLSQQEFFKRNGLIKIKPVILWKCGNEETQAAYHRMEKEVLDISRQRSNDIEKQEISYVIPFEDHNFIVKSNGKSSPLFFNKIAYSIFSLFFLSFPFRLYYLNTIRTLQLNICKKVFI